MCQSLVSRRFKNCGTPRSRARPGPAAVGSRCFARRAKHGPDRDRTCDLGIKSPLLYQLSYRPSPASVALRSAARLAAGPHRLAVKVTALSRLQRGFESRWGHKLGRLAQLGERLPYKQEVACSSHAPPIAPLSRFRPCGQRPLEEWPTQFRAAAALGGWNELKRGSGQQSRAVVRQRSWLGPHRRGFRARLQPSPVRGRRR